MNASLSRLIAAMVYPRAVDDYVRLALPLHSTREVRARVVDVRRETHDVATLVLKPNARWSGHRAGQHVALTAEIGGVRTTRYFSIASAEDRPTIEITVKARPGGVATPVLVAGKLLGQIVELSEAKGDFVLPAVLPELLLFVSGGSGITPVMSMLRTLVGSGRTTDVTFLHYARSNDDVIFREELDRLARQARPGLRIRVVLGRFDATSFAAQVPDFDRRETWACGPEPFLSALTNAFAERRAESRVRIERFSLAPTHLRRTDEASETETETEVTFVASQKRVRGKGPILAMAEGAGLRPESGCRMGICHTCVRRKVSGTTRDLRTGQLSTDADVDVQLCVSEAVGAVAIDL